MNEEEINPCMHCMKTKLYNSSLGQAGFNEIYQLQIEARLIQAIRKAKSFQKNDGINRWISLLENVVDPS